MTTDVENDDRHKYWNENYVAYWKARVEEANCNQENGSVLVVGDTNTSNDHTNLNAISLLNITKEDQVLELGCGFGRSLSTLCQASLQVTAVDISEQMINAAQDLCQEKNVSFHVSPSEKLPFAAESFDVIVCFAAFDAMYQTQALIEMNRVAKSGARILITGKNDNYYDDDQAAIAAEIGARSKHHPNYFTDIDKFLRHSSQFGFNIIEQKYYARRGDFSTEKFHDVMPNLFYEYLLILQKKDDCIVSKDFVISEKISKTFVRSSL